MPGVSLDLKVPLEKVPGAVSGDLQKDRNVLPATKSSPKWWHLESWYSTLFEQAGIQINGSLPWDIRVHNSRLWQRILVNGSLGLGEGYVERWWDCDQLDVFVEKIMRAGLWRQGRGLFPFLRRVLPTRLFNFQTHSRAFQVGELHYDIGDDLFEAMLDRRMTYSCAYWPRAQTLDQAQEDKLALICRKLGLKPGDRVLDIGCGWGSFAGFAAERYGAQVAGITVSRCQAEAVARRYPALPITIQLQDYRDLEGQFDHVVSVGMFEHVGYKNYQAFFEVVSRVLNHGGLFLLHTIGNNASQTGTDPWIGKYIFPNSLLPSIAQIGKAIEGRFVMEDWQNFGPDYDRTLMAWSRNFESAWPQLREHYSESFHRMWRYYLLSCAGTFRSREIQLWQVVLSRPGEVVEYHASR